MKLYKYCNNLCYDIPNDITRTVTVEGRARTSLKQMLTEFFPLSLVTIINLDERQVRQANGVDLSIDANAYRTYTNVVNKHIPLHTRVGQKLGVGAAPFGVAPATASAAHVSGMSSAYDVLYGAGVHGRRTPEPVATPETHFNPKFVPKFTQPPPAARGAVVFQPPPPQVMSGLAVPQGALPNGPNTDTSMVPYTPPGSTPASRLKSPAPAPAPGYQGQRPRQFPLRGVCFNCAQAGHFFQACPVYPGMKPDRTPLPGPGCARCGGYHHGACQLPHITNPAQCAEVMKRLCAAAEAAAQQQA